LSTAVCQCGHIAPVKSGVRKTTGTRRSDLWLKDELGAEFIESKIVSCWANKLNEQGLKHALMDARKINWVN
jgi:hypothetical protein